ncbi:MAG TPA: type IX secretion system sortase PorU [Prolixibacteraceae bacterium]|nr:type IX secretion system sortase PorU [Prolixibacteraceae bacterium]
MRKLLLLNVLLFSILLGWATDFQKKVVWNQTVSSDESDPLALVRLFNDAVISEKNNLPYWIESIKLQSSNTEIVISNPVFEPLNNPSVVLPDTLGSELQYSIVPGTSAGKHYARVSVLPFVRINGQVQKLMEFTLSVKEDENPLMLKAAKAAFDWKQSSVLSTGKWAKIKIKSKGIYKITYDQLKSWGYPNPENVVLYGNGGHMLPLLNRDLKADDLLPYPVWKGKDNTGKDCLFFYATGNIKVNYDPSNATFSHQQNYYATETYFYLSDQGTANLMQIAPEITGNATQQVTTFPNYTFYEKELDNLIHSGSTWYGERFNMNESRSFTVSLDNPELATQATITVSAAGKSSSSSSMEIQMNGKSILNIPFSLLGLYEFATEGIKSTLQTLPGNTIQLKLTFNATNNVSAAYLDFISINYMSALGMNGDVTSFRGRGGDGGTQVSEFVLSGATSGTKVLNVSDIHQVFEMPSSYLNNQLRFKSNSTAMTEYVAFNPTGAIPAPEFVGNVENQNLHGGEMTEMIIVTHSAFSNVANDLAEFHRLTDQMTVKVVIPELIYNEFSGGLPDPAALRNYFRMFYEKGNQSGSTALKYVLLLGDGSYDNRNIQGKNFNLLPTYQSENSLSEVKSFVTDDFFAMLDETEGGISGMIDLGIGRIPANTLPEAQQVIDKIKDYHKKETKGNWRNIVTFIADDGDGNLHQEDAESLADIVDRYYPGFYSDKIYFDAFKKITSAGGGKYPDVTAKISDRVKQGTLIMNYTGHANARNLADENVLDIGTIDSWTNKNHLPIFVTATCEYSRYDANEKSAGEHILFNPNGGGIGLFSTTRLVYANENSTLNKQFFNYIFEKDDQGNNLRLGDVMRLAKVAASTGTNQLNFSLLADPALRLGQPEYKVVTTSIDDKDAQLETDTLKTLSVVKVKGYIANSEGTRLSSFNGEIVPTIYDKAIEAKTLGNPGQTPMQYKVQNNIIHRGLASVKDGEFEFSFFIPKDISYKIDKGKILYYAYNETNDAHGYFDNFYIGGTSDAPITDAQGPEIELFMNSESFRDGGQVSASSVLIAHIVDNTGINTAGTGIGHDITAVLDGDYSNSMVLNDYFQTNMDKHTEGSVVFPLSNLSEGKHTLTIKVWDVLNNSSEKEITFVVKDNFGIESVQSYPNPMTEQTSFVFTHNQHGETFDVTLDVFQANGTRVDRLQARVGSNGIESQPLEWNPVSRSVKMQAGVYIYRMTVMTPDGKTSSGSGRLVYVYR